MEDIDAARLLLQKMGIDPADLLQAPLGHRRSRPSPITFPGLASSRRRDPPRLRHLLEPRSRDLGAKTHHLGVPPRDQPTRPRPQGERHPAPQRPRRTRCRRAPDRRPALHVQPRGGRPRPVRGREPSGTSTQATQAAQRPHGLPDSRLSEITAVAASTGNDPALDSLVIRLHMETACRRGGALSLTPSGLDPGQCLIRLNEKGGTERWQPVSPTLMAHLPLVGAAQVAGDVSATGVPAKMAEATRAIQRAHSRQ